MHKYRNHIPKVQRLRMTRIPRSLQVGTVPGGGALSDRGDGVRLMIPHRLDPDGRVLPDVRIRFRARPSADVPVDPDDSSDGGGRGCADDGGGDLVDSGGDDGDGEDQWWYGGRPTVRQAPTPSRITRSVTVRTVRRRTTLGRSTDPVPTVWVLPESPLRISVHTLTRTRRTPSRPNSSLVWREFTEMPNFTILLKITQSKMRLCLEGIGVIKR